MSIKKFPQFVLAAPTSGTGKTTITMALLAALKKRGLRVQPFKVGPDYIDPRMHESIVGGVSYNLDSFFMSEEYLYSFYAERVLDTDAVVVEGVMGMFDGYLRDKGSSASIAKTLNIPVVLIVSGKSVAFSVAPLIHGFRSFDPKVKIAGVIFNQVSSDSHFSFLKDACEAINIPCFGYLKKDPAIAMPSRYLGLFSEKGIEMEDLVDRLVENVEAHLDLDHLLACTMEEQPVSVTSPLNEEPRVSTAIAHDEAFAFLYPGVVDYFKQLGEVKFFSPLKNEPLPDCDFLFIPGGYPELYAKELASSFLTKDSIVAFAAQGGKIWGECGGLMFLAKELVDEQGESYPMCGLLDLSTTMVGKRLHLGYRRWVVNGTEWRGHEFHYSKEQKIGDVEQFPVTIYDARGNERKSVIYRNGNVFGSYIHIYWDGHHPFSLYNIE